MKTTFSLHPVSQKDRAAIQRYAASQRSDPFAAARAYTHLRNGSASPGDYDAEIEVHNDGAKTIKKVSRA